MLTFLSRLAYGGCVFGLVTGTTTKPANLATRSELAICGTRCATILGLVGYQVCGLADGQIDGPSHGGNVEVSGQDGYDCWIVCTGMIIGKR